MVTTVEVVVIRATRAVDGCQCATDRDPVTPPVGTANYSIECRLFLGTLETDRLGVVFDIGAVTLEEVLDVF